MNLVLPPFALADEEARYLRDILLDIPGLTRMRGPIKPAANFITTGNRIYGLTSCVDPSGTNHVAALTGPAAAGTSYLEILSTDFASLVAQAFPTNLFSSTTYPVVDSKPKLNGGTLIGSATGYLDSDTKTVAIWRGGSDDNYSTGTITATQGSKTVTGSGTSWTNPVSPGMFLLRDSDKMLIGVVETVDSATQITLELPALVDASAGSDYLITPFRGWVRRVATGRITTATDDTAVTGSFTKFTTLMTGTVSDWNIYTNPDLEFVGTVSSIEDETSLTLSANASIALDNERFVAIRSNQDYTDLSDHVGFLNAQYSGRQFYAENSRVYFSDTLDPEAVDNDPTDGDFFDIGSAQDYDSPLYALAPTYNALLFIKESEVFALYGNSPGQWQVRKLHNDGALCGSSVAYVEGGCVWAGRGGIYFYDGIEVRNLSEDKLGQWYTKGLIDTFDPTTDRMYGMVDRNHYFLFIESFNGTNTGVGVTEGDTTTYPTRLTICINLATGAFTVLTNHNFRGSVALPAEDGKGTIYAVNKSATNHGALALMSDLWDSTGADTFTCEGDSAGPKPYIESKKYDAGDPERKKLWKQLQLQYNTTGDDLSFDTIVGLNDDGITSSSVWTAFSTWVNKRIKFLKRSTHIAFRIYGSPTVMKLGPWALGFKYQRKGRV